MPSLRWCFRPYAAQYQVKLTKRGGKPDKQKASHLAYISLPRTQREASAQAGTLFALYSGQHH